jgi:aspartate aminotransferase
VAELPINNSDHFCQWMLKDYEFRGETVMLAPCTGFYSNQELGRTQVRLAYVLKIKELQRAMDCLEHGLKKYLESTHANH